MRTAILLLVVISGVVAKSIMIFPHNLEKMPGKEIVEQIPVEIVELPEPVFIIPALRTVELTQEIEEPEPIAISNEIVPPYEDKPRLENFEKPLNTVEVPKPEADAEPKKVVEVAPEEKLKPEKAKADDEKTSSNDEVEEQRKDDQLQVETVQDERFEQRLVPALAPEEIDVNVAPGVGQKQVASNPAAPATEKPTTQAPNPFQQIIQNTQNTLGSFLGLRPANAPAETADATTQQSIFQNIQSSFQNGIQQFSATLGITPPPATAEDVVTTPRPGPLQQLQAIVAPIQQSIASIFQGPRVTTVAPAAPAVPVATQTVPQTAAQVAQATSPVIQVVGESAIRDGTDGDEFDSVEEDTDEISVRKAQVDKVKKIQDPQHVADVNVAGNIEQAAASNVAETKKD